MTAPRAAPPAARPGVDLSLVQGPGVPSPAAHLARWGELPRSADVVGLAARARLRGRGGAGFPTGHKLSAVRAAVAERRRPAVVVANGVESEPLSRKDRLLLEVNPQLVLDGMSLAARALGADRAVLCLGPDAPGLAALLRRAIELRHDPCEMQVATVPPGYLSSEESALVNWLTTGRSLPTLSPPRPAERGVDGRPTLVDNVETLATLAVIARVGPEVWGSVGTPEEPGSMLVTVSGAVARPGVLDVPMGTALADVLERAVAEEAAGVLVGGYFGNWLSRRQVAGAHLSRRSLGALGATPGCGVVVVLPEGCCPAAEVTRVAGWLAGQRAGQCGPCTNGLPGIARALAAAVAGGRDGADALGWARRWAAMVRGRGACKLPDGAALFVTSALEVFADHFACHLERGPCPPARGALLPVPPNGRWPVAPVAPGPGARR